MGKTGKEDGKGGEAEEKRGNKSREGMEGLRGRECRRGDIAAAPPLIMGFAFDYFTNTFLPFTT